MLEISDRPLFKTSKSNVMKKIFLSIYTVVLRQHFQVLQRMLFAAEF